MTTKQDTWTITLHCPVPSGNKLKRMHWRDYHNLIGEWRHDVFYLCREAKIPKLARITVEVTIYFEKERVRDIPNYIFSLDKCLLDSLVTAEVIFDDNPSFVTDFKVNLAVDRKNPRVEVTITDNSNE